MTLRRDNAGFSSSISLPLGTLPTTSVLKERRMGVQWPRGLRRIRLPGARSKLGLLSIIFLDSRDDLIDFLVGQERCLGIDQTLLAIQFRGQVALAE